MTDMRILIGIVCLVLLIFGCDSQMLPLSGGSSDTEVSAKVEGRAVDIYGDPAIGAEVRLRPSDYLPESSADPNNSSRNQLTDSLGVFIFDSVPAGAYAIEISTSDSDGVITNCEVFPRDKKVSLGICTLKPNALISGHAVLGSSRSAPVLQIYGIEKTITPDSTGFFTMSIPEGTHCLKISGPEEYDQLEVTFEAFSSEHKYIGWFWLNPKLHPPCNDYSCDSLTVRQILDSCGRQELPVDSVSVVRSGRITELHLRGFGSKAGSQLIGRLGFLEILDLGENQLETPPFFLNQLWILQVLKLDRNSLTVIPENMGFLIYLRHLDISYNNLRILPVSITNLRPFELLDLSNNNLCSLSQSQSSWAAFYDPDWNNSQKCSNIIVQEK